MLKLTSFQEQLISACPTPLFEMLVERPPHMYAGLGTSTDCTVRLADLHTTAIWISPGSKVVFLRCSLTKRRARTTSKCPGNTIPRMSLRFSDS